jgi:hypothetical protein
VRHQIRIALVAAAFLATCAVAGRIAEPPIESGGDAEPHARLSSRGVSLVFVGAMGAVMLRSRAISPRADLLWVAASVPMIVYAVLKAIPYPTGDSGYFEFIGRQMHDGARLYRDVWDNKLPSIYLTNELWQTLLGERYRLHVAVEIAIQASSAALFAVVMRRIGVHFWAPATFAFVAVVIALPHTYNSTEQYALPFSLLVVLALLYGRPILCGVAVVACASYWLPGSLMVVPAVMWWRSDRSRLGRFVAAAGVTTIAAFAFAYAMLGAASLRVLAASWFLYVTEPGAMGHGTLAFLKALSLSLRKGLYISGVGIFLPLYLARVRPPQTREQGLALSWSLAALAATMTSTRFFAHYFFLAIPALIAAVAVFPPRPVRWLNATALLACTYFAIRSLQLMTNEASYERAQAERILQAGTMIQQAIGRGAVVEAAEEPGLMLAAHARPRTPYAMAVLWNPRFVQRASAGIPATRPQVWLATEATSMVPPNSDRLCEIRIDRWRLFLRPDVAPRFPQRTCPTQAAVR